MLCDEQWVDADLDESNGIDSMDEPSVLRLDSLVMVTQVGDVAVAMHMIADNLTINQWMAMLCVMLVSTGLTISGAFLLMSFITSLAHSFSSWFLSTGVHCPYKTESARACVTVFCCYL